MAMRRPFTILRFALAPRFVCGTPQRLPEMDCRQRPADESGADKGHVRDGLENEPCPCGSMLTLLGQVAGCVAYFVDFRRAHRSLCSLSPVMSCHCSHSLLV